MVVNAFASRLVFSAKERLGAMSGPMVFGESSLTYGESVLVDISADCTELTGDGTNVKGSVYARRNLSVLVELLSG